MLSILFKLHSVPLSLLSLLNLLLFLNLLQFKAIYGQFYNPRLSLDRKVSTVHSTVSFKCLTLGTRDFFLARNGRKYLASFRRPKAADKSIEAIEAWPPPETEQEKPLAPRVPMSLSFTVHIQSYYTHNATYQQQEVVDQVSMVGNDLFIRK